MLFLLRNTLRGSNGPQVGKAEMREDCVHSSQETQGVRGENRPPWAPLTPQPGLLPLASLTPCRHWDKGPSRVLGAALEVEARAILIWKYGDFVGPLCLSLLVSDTCLRRGAILLILGASLLYCSLVRDAWSTFFLHDALLPQTAPPGFPWKRSSPDTPLPFSHPVLHAQKVLQHARVHGRSYKTIFKLYSHKNSDCSQSCICIAQLFSLSPGIKYNFLPSLRRVSCTVSFLFCPLPLHHPTFNSRI